MEYIGNELELFADAVNWKKYYSSFLQKEVKGKVLEVGAGLGGTTPFLLNDTVTKWVCLEPDIQMSKIIQEKIDSNILPSICQVKSLTTHQYKPEDKFDTILYIDVLEHIEDDSFELEYVSRFLADGGKIIVLSPSYPFLYGPFDSSLGHYRRYNNKLIKKAISDKFLIRKLIYLDSMGTVLSFVNKIVLKQKLPTGSQISFWDTIIIRLSKIIDHLFLHKFGKSVIFVISLK